MYVTTYFTSGHLLVHYISVNILCVRFCAACKCKIVTILSVVQR